MPHAPSSIVDLDALVVKGLRHVVAEISAEVGRKEAQEATKGPVRPSHRSGSLE